MKQPLAPPSARILAGLAMLVLLFAAYAYLRMTAIGSASAAMYGEGESYPLAMLGWGAIALAGMLVAAGLGFAAWRGRRGRGQPMKEL